MSIKQRAGNAYQAMADFIGSPLMFWIINLVVAGWIIWNRFGPAAQRWDPWPFILLNLVLSWQAANATPILQMSSNFQEERDRKFSEKMDREILEIRRIVRRLEDKLEAMEE